MTKKFTVEAPLNRVEGDLEVRAEVEDGVVTQAWCSATMYRGFEKILVGRGALDGLVITPRICGVCTTSHLTAAVNALERIAGFVPPQNALRLRHVVAMAEHVQSDIRHSFLSYAADFANPAHAAQPLFAEATRRYAPFTGETSLRVIREIRRIPEIIAIIGGQWPHSSYMVPGGIASVPTASDLLQCGFLLHQVRVFYEQRVLGCPIERFAEVQDSEDLDAWLEESEAHREGELGFFLRFARAIGLASMGVGPESFLSFGGQQLPNGTAFAAPSGAPLLASGFARSTFVDRLDERRINEHVAHSWFVDYGGGRHPSEGETRPYATGREGNEYSWAKAPRYQDAPAETGPLAQAVVARHPLLSSLVERQGASAFARQLARVIRPALLIPSIERLLAEMEPTGPLYEPCGPIPDGAGEGLVEATRGALGHWVAIENGAIAHYQIVTPTAWNASPRDSLEQPGPIEAALVGTPVADPANPVELGHVVRSFDPCLVCTVHTVTRRTGAPTATVRLP